jgi:hypothetical protein
VNAVPAGPNSRARPEQSHAEMPFLCCAGGWAYREGVTFYLAVDPGSSQHAYAAGTGRTLCGLSLGRQVSPVYKPWRQRAKDRSTCRECAALVLADEPLPA